MNELGLESVVVSRANVRGGDDAAESGSGWIKRTGEISHRRTATLVLRGADEQRWRVEINWLVDVDGVLTSVVERENPVGSEFVFDAQRPLLGVGVAQFVRVETQRRDVEE